MKRRHGAFLLISAFFLIVLATADQNLISPGGSQIDIPRIIAAGGVLLLAAGTAFITFKISFLSIRLIVAGVGTVFIGTVLLLYGDYSGGSLYAVGGALAVLIGVILLLVGDWKAGAFNKRIAKWLEDVSANK